MEQNDRFDLRIDNQSFSNLYLEEKTKQNFKYEESTMSTKDDLQSPEEIKKGTAKQTEFNTQFSWKEDAKISPKKKEVPVQKQINLLDVFDEPVSTSNVENISKEKSAASDLLDLEFNQKPTGLNDFGDLGVVQSATKEAIKPSFGSTKDSKAKGKDDFFSSDFQF